MGAKSLHGNPFTSFAYLFQTSPLFSTARRHDSCDFSAYSRSAVKNLGKEVEMNLARDAPGA